MNGSQAGSLPELHHGRRLSGAPASEKTNIFPAVQQETKLLLIGQFIHVTSLSFTEKVKTVEEPQIRTALDEDVTEVNLIK